MYTYTDMKDDISDYRMIQNLLEILSALYFIKPNNSLKCSILTCPVHRRKKNRGRRSEDRVGSKEDLQSVLELNLEPGWQPL